MQKYVFAFTSVLDWVSEWVGDSFGCDAIVSPSLLHLFLHLPRCLIGFCGAGGLWLETWVVQVNGHLGQLGGEHHQCQMKECHLSFNYSVAI